MRVAVTSLGPDLDSEVDHRFARATFIVSVDPETGQFTVHPNPHGLNGSHDAGLHVAQEVLDLGVDVVITGNMGHKAFAKLQAGDVKVYLGVVGTVKHAVEQWDAGELVRASELRFERHSVGLRYQGVA